MSPQKNLSRRSLCNWCDIDEDADAYSSETICRTWVGLVRHNYMANVTSKISFIAAKTLMNKSGEGAVKFSYFDIMHSVLKNTGTANPIHAIDT